MIVPRSKIFEPLFSDDRILSLFSDHKYVQAMLEVEAALARVQVKEGIIPPFAGEKITNVANSAEIDLDEIAKNIIHDGFPVISLVKQLRDLVGPEVADYVHYGATTQDIMDTACVFQFRLAIDLMDEQLTHLNQSLGKLTNQYRSTVMAGRTHGQQALPISFGLKAAGWLAPLIRHQERLHSLKPRVLMVQFGGAAGTLAALGSRGLAVMDEMAKELNLTSPLIPWHTQRDGFAELANWLSMTSASLAKIAQDIVLLTQTEVGEVRESSDHTRGGSSTMPQKSNPIISEWIIAAARTNSSLLSTVHNALIQEHERATHGWQMEWLTLPQMIMLTSGALKQASFLTDHLKVNDEKMEDNLIRANHLVLAEAIVFALSKEVSRSEAHTLVKESCHIAVSSNRPLVNVVQERYSQIKSDSSIDWMSLSEPVNYLGSAHQMIDRVLNKIESP